MRRLRLKFSNMPIQPEIVAINSDTEFRFGCTPEVPCFNACCRDLNQALTPYDVACLRRGLKLSSRNFLEAYTFAETGSRSGLPVVMLKPVGATRLCPFLSPQGCRVYATRPSSCRMYPLMRLARRERVSGAIKVDYLLLQEPHCRGFEQSATHTPTAWEAHQELAPYNHMNDQFLEIISLKNRWHPQSLSFSQQRDFYSACYDLDGFNTSAESRDTDDCTRLADAMQWIKKHVFRISNCIPPTGG